MEDVKREQTRINRINRAIEMLIAEKREFNGRLLKMKIEHTHRKDHEPPQAFAEWGWRYHHIGIPTTTKMAGEIYLPHLKMYVSGFSSSPFGIEWMRFEPDCPISELVKTVPHIAFEVDDLDAALLDHDFEIISKPSSPSAGVRVAMIVHNGAPVELIEFN